MSEVETWTNFLESKPVDLSTKTVFWLCWVTAKQNHIRWSRPNHYFPYLLKVGGRYGTNKSINISPCRVPPGLTSSEWLCQTSRHCHKITLHTRCHIGRVWNKNSNSSPWTEDQVNVQLLNQIPPTGQWHDGGQGVWKGKPRTSPGRPRASGQSGSCHTKDRASGACATSTHRFNSSRTRTQGPQDAREERRKKWLQIQVKKPGVCTPILLLSNAGNLKKWFPLSRPRFPPL